MIFIPSVVLRVLGWPPRRLIPDIHALHNPLPLCGRACERDEQSLPRLSYILWQRRDVFKIPKALPN